MNLENMFKDVLNDIYLSILKPLGWKKEGNNFRLFCEDGLCKIINFQKSKWNSATNCEFYINMGIYFEKERDVINRRFKEYECLIRSRALKENGSYILYNDADLNEVKKNIREVINLEVLMFMDCFPTKKDVITMILSGKAQTYTGVPVWHYDTCKMLVEMGYGKEILPFIENKKGVYFDKLISAIKNL